jgi:hypothetical protein
MQPSATCGPAVSSIGPACSHPSAWSGPCRAWTIIASTWQPGVARPASSFGGDLRLLQARPRALAASKIKGGAAAALQGNTSVNTPGDWGPPAAAVRPLGRNDPPLRVSCQVTDPPGDVGAMPLLSDACRAQIWEGRKPKLEAAGGPQLPPSGSRRRGDGLSQMEGRRGDPAAPSFPVPVERGDGSSETEESVGRGRVCRARRGGDQATEKSTPSGRRRRTHT